MVEEAMRNEILQGDVIQKLAEIPDNHVHCCVTSPPYWGLRDYGEFGQIGLEKTPEEYIDKMVQVFREVKRVLRDDGTLWLNIGDSYNGSGGAGGDYSVGGLKEGQPKYPGRNIGTLKPKDLVGIPWMVAFALRADGWYLRSDIIWHKPNPMPESVTDRPTKAHEYIFLLAKSQKYFYDAEAIKEPYTEPLNRWGGDKTKPTDRTKGDEFAVMEREGRDRRPDPSGRNRRSVWEITTQPYSGAHFATFPEQLPKLCILAGTSEKGVCDNCGAPQVRMVERTFNGEHNKSEGASQRERCNTMSGGTESVTLGRTDDVKTKTIGWEASCECSAGIQPAIVLDPFFGSGTTGKVAVDNGRDWLGIELNPKYVTLAKKRIASAKPQLIFQ